ncbi:Uncharacterised protein [uncultured archaeon]|nr:Uncharacterised protein [uncultured archaeon]
MKNEKKQEEPKPKKKHSDLLITIAAFITIILSILLVMKGNYIVIALVGLLVLSTIIYYYPLQVEFLSKIKVKGKKVWGLYFLGIIAIILYLLTGSNTIMGIIAFLIILLIAINEFLPEEKGSQGMKKAAAEIVYSVFFAVTAWTLLTLILNTQTPINVVTSCSMLPTLSRGDLLLLQGTQVNTQEIDINTTYNEFLSKMIPIPEPCYIKNDAGAVREDRCINSFIYENKKYNFTKTGDIIVYNPTVKIAQLQSALQGIDLIVHRAVLKVKATDGTFILTKGDNNPTPDQIGVVTGSQANQIKDQHIQIFCFDDSRAGRICTVSPWIEQIEENKILGKSILDIPYIGYVKLLLFAETQEPANCKETIVPQ